MDEETTYRVTLHLASGQTVTTEASYPSDLDEYEVADALQHALAGNHKPGWRRVENVVAFSQAISALEVGEISAPEAA